MKYRIQLPDGKSIIVDKEESGLYRDVMTLHRYSPEDLKSVERINDCADCFHLSTPKGKQCYTISRMIKEKIKEKGLPFDPTVVIPLLDELGEHCKRYQASNKIESECE